MEGVSRSNETAKFHRSFNRRSRSIVNRYFEFERVHADGIEKKGSRNLEIPGSLEFGILSGFKQERAGSGSNQSSEQLRMQGSSCKSSVARK